MSLLSRFVSVFHKRKLECDLDDELRSHLEMRIQDNIDAGMPEAEARLDAIRRFGNATLIKENTRSTRIMVPLETVLQDLRFGCRTLCKSPGFTIVALLTLAFSIGATTAVFTMVNAVLLRPLPYTKPDRLISSAVTIPVGGFIATPAGDLQAWQEQATNLEAVAGFTGTSCTLTGSGDPTRIKAAKVTSNFLPLLGVTPQLGRTFSAEEDQPHGELVALLTNGLWQERFGADRQIVGRRISLDEARYTIIGVLPSEFRFPSSEVEPDILLPLQLAPQVRASSPQRATDKDFVLLGDTIGLLKPGVSIKTAASELDSISRRVHAQYSPGSQVFLKGSKIEVASLQEKLVGKVQRPLLIMLAAVGLVLMIGCFNIASMQLARAVERGGEFCVRAALGAKRGRLLRQLVTENLLLSCTGAVPGILLSGWLVSMFRAGASRALPHIATVRVDLWVLGFAALAALGSGMFFGLLPAVWINRTNVNQEAIKGRRS